MAEHAAHPLQTLWAHWPEYLIEAAGLGAFMVSAGVFATLLEHPASPVRQALTDDTLRRVLMGIAMGLTAIAIIYSPWGRRSGAHINPAVTLTFLLLRKITPVDAAAYLVAQFAGGLAGLLLARAVLGEALSAAPVMDVATLPGVHGVGVAFAAELAISFGLMLTVLLMSNSPRFGRYTGLCAGALVALYIAVEAPLSGMSMNPARTVASAAPAGLWQHTWIYFVAPPLGMLLAAALYRAGGRTRAVWCAKLHHDHAYRCIFRCSHP